MMSGITGSMNLGASAMNAHAWGMAVTAHNVANVNTAGFTPQHAVYATGPGGTDLGREMTQMISTQRTYEANAQVVRTGDAMLGTLLDLKA